MSSGITIPVESGFVKLYVDDKDYLKKYMTAEVNLPPSFQVKIVYLLLLLAAIKEGNFFVFQRRKASID